MILPNGLDSSVGEFVESEKPDRVVCLRSGSCLPEGWETPGSGVETVAPGWGVGCGVAIRQAVDCGVNVITTGSYQPGVLRRTRAGVTTTVIELGDSLAARVDTRDGHTTTSIIPFTGGAIPINERT